jgi:hypothetical protein
MRETQATLDMEASGATFLSGGSVLEGQAAAVFLVRLLSLARSFTDPGRFSKTVEDFADAPVPTPVYSPLFAGIPPWDYDQEPALRSSLPPVAVATSEEEE